MYCSPSAAIIRSVVAQLLTFPRACRVLRPVERRGREIGALFARRILNPESNLCYGEGGAGTWSDGKLTTRIGRNSGEVRKVQPGATPTC